MRAKKLPVSGPTFCTDSQQPQKAPNDKAAQQVTPTEPSSTVSDDLGHLESKVVNFQSTLDDEDHFTNDSVNERGLPSDGALLDLANTYLSLQGELWPELLKSGTLPPASVEAIREYATGFRQRFLHGLVPSDFESPAGSKEFGASYLRYSCDNSNPRSLDQQLHNALHRARQDRVFIPWNAVCADAAVSGTIANRRGYRLVKELLISPKWGIERLYIDEIGRVSRDAIEALRLGRLVQFHKKRLIGVTDGFDSAQAQSQWMLGMFAMMHEQFVTQLRDKVDRGMRDAFVRGDNIRPASFGYKLVPCLDASGNPVFCVKGKDKQTVMAKVVDESESPWVQFAHTKFEEHRWSPDRLARHFNDHQVGGRRNWKRRQIIMLLTRPTYIGIEYERMTKRIADPDTGKVTIVNRPKEEWLKREVPHLRIISDEMYRKTQARLAEIEDSTKRRRKIDAKGNEVYPKTLFRPLCFYCKNPLYKGRGGKYASYQCLNGSMRGKKCKLCTFKAVRILEMCILDHLRSVVFTDDFVTKLVTAANVFLAAEVRLA